MKHHEVFDKFGCWKGYAKPEFAVNFLGIITKQDYFIRDNTAKSESPLQQRFVATNFPNFDEEYFEWIDVLEAVIMAQGQFTMIELGAGWGRWIANGVAALRQFSDLPYTLIGVEPEPTHFRWMGEHLRINGVNLTRCQLIEAAVETNDGTVWFYTGCPAEWYGQAIAPPPGPLRLRERLRRHFGKPEVRVKKVKSISLNTLLRSLHFVDLIDLDVQGAELTVLENAAAELGKVRRVHIGTHSAEIEFGLRRLFHAMGWEKVNDYSCGCEHDTPWGVIKFQDGVQTWINTRL